MVALMESIHLLTSLEALSEGALFSRGLVLLLGEKVSDSGGGMKVLVFLVLDGESGMSGGLLVPCGELGAADWGGSLAL